MLLLEETKFQVPDLNQDAFSRSPTITLFQKATFCKVKQESPPRLWWTKPDKFIFTPLCERVSKVLGVFTFKKAGVFLVSPAPNYEVKRLLLFWISAWSCWISNHNNSEATRYRCTPIKNLVNMQGSRILSSVNAVFSICLHYGWMFHSFFMLLRRNISTYLGT